MAKSDKVEVFLGKEVKITCNDRFESEYTGEFLGNDGIGCLLSYQDHGRDFICFLPFSTISFINHKVVAEKPQA